jgi:hypothetical protein
VLHFLGRLVVVVVISCVLLVGTLGLTGNLTASTRSCVSGLGVAASGLPRAAQRDGWLILHSRALWGDVVGAWGDMVHVERSGERMVRALMGGHTLLPAAKSIAAGSKDSASLLYRGSVLFTPSARWEGGVLVRAVSGCATSSG